MSEQPNNPLHGITLSAIVEDLVARHGWEELGALIPIRCFQYDPSVGSSLKFLRKMPWARSQVEQLYLADQRRIAQNRERNRRRAASRARAAEAGGAERDADEPPLASAQIAEPVLEHAEPGEDGGLRAKHP